MKKFGRRGFLAGLAATPLVKKVKEKPPDTFEEAAEVVPAAAEWTGETLGPEMWDEFADLYGGRKAVVRRGDAQSARMTLLDSTRMVSLVMCNLTQESPFFSSPNSGFNWSATAKLCYPETDLEWVNEAWKKNARCRVLLEFCPYIDQYAYVWSGEGYLTDLTLTEQETGLLVVDLSIQGTSVLTCSDTTNT